MLRIRTSGNCGRAIKGRNEILIYRTRVLCNLTKWKKLYRFAACFTILHFRYTLCLIDITWYFGILCCVWRCESVKKILRDNRISSCGSPFLLRTIVSWNSFFLFYRSYRVLSMIHNDTVAREEKSSRKKIVKKNRRYCMRGVLHL